MFVDHIKVYAKAGNGGDGAISFRREKYIPRGGPDGGDGGKGGDIILRVDPHTDNLKAFFYNPNLRAQHGSRGAGRLKSGQSGASLILLVPAGTLVYRVVDATVVPMGTAPSYADSGEHNLDEETESVTRSLKKSQHREDLELIADLTQLGQEFILAKGGRGGKGNDHFKTSTNRAPRENTPGEPGGEGVFFLELRQIADVGLVGFPNAGKSTILTKLSAARPKVAAYPFTTLKPMVGVIEFDAEHRLTMADIPGLIEGAHDNVGLGHDFLRHILRCRVLLFVVDIAGSEARDPVQDLMILRTEVSLYDKLLAKRPWVIVANKMDLPGAEENLQAVKSRFPRVKVLPLSAEMGTGVDKLRTELRKRIQPTQA